MIKKQKIKNYFNKRNNGITLIALVITIIVLLILAGVSVTMLSGNNSILTNVSNAKEKTEKQYISENLKINIMEKMTDNNNNGIKKDELKDILEKYFKDVPDNVKEITTLMTKEKEYTIDISEIISNVKLIDEEDDDEGFYIQGTGNVGTNNYPKYKIYGDTKGYNIYYNLYSVNEDWNEIKSSKVKYNGNEFKL